MLNGRNGFHFSRSAMPKNDTLTPIRFTDRLAFLHFGTVRA
jgi:hypothetical protein